LGGEKELVELRWEKKRKPSRERDVGTGKGYGFVKRIRNFKGKNYQSPLSACVESSISLKGCGSTYAKDRSFHTRGERNWDVLRL